MAKLKRNHTKRSHSLFPGGMKILFFLFLLGLSLALYFFRNNSNLGTSEPIEDDYFSESPTEKGKPGMLKVQDAFLPTTNLGKVIKQQHYAISYVEDFEQAEWVAYELTKESIQAPNVKRTGDFRRDQAVSSRSAEREDYKGSGYDRGHLTPAGDMAFSLDAMSSTFLMSNISPQVRAFNGGIWRELEENVRNWAYRNEHLYVVSGPVLTEKALDYIGNNKVAVPSKYYKVILDFRQPDIKAIAFVLPNEVSNKHLREYAVTIDEVEQLTGLNFFSSLLPENQEEELEGKMDISDWKFDDGKYQARIKSWNNR